MGRLIMTSLLFFYDFLSPPPPLSLSLFRTIYQTAKNHSKVQGKNGISNYPRRIYCKNIILKCSCLASLMLTNRYITTVATVYLLPQEHHHEYHFSYIIDNDHHLWISLDLQQVLEHNVFHRWLLQFPLLPSTERK